MKTEDPSPRQIPEVPSPVILTLRIVVGAAILSALLNPLEISLPGRIGMAIGAALAIAGMAAGVVLLRMLFAAYKLPPLASKAQGFIAAMFVPALIIAPVSLWITYENLENRRKEEAKYKEAVERALESRSKEAARQERVREMNRHIGE